MKVSAFTFAKNVLQLGYPLRECIESLLPIADEVVVNVGVPDTDGTLDLVRSLDEPKIRIVESRWNPRMNFGGHVLAQQTNIALFNCTGDWAIYLQADEVLHENDLDHLREQMRRHHHDDAVEGLTVRRQHFYGDYFTTLRVYDQDFPCRVVKPHKFVLSRGDAAGFSVHRKYKERGRRIRVVSTDVTIFHYGLCDVGKFAAKETMIADLWVKPNSGSTPEPETGADQPEPETGADQQVDAGQKSAIHTRLPRQFVEAFHGTHPAVMKNRVESGTYRLDLSPFRWRTKLTVRERVLLLKRHRHKALRGFLRRYFLRRDSVILNR